MVRRFFFAGKELHDLRDYSSAVAKFTEALELTDLGVEDRAVLYLCRSSSYLGICESKAAGNLTFLELPADIDSPGYRALCDAKQVIGLCPTWYRGYVNAGKAYNELNKFEKAVVILSRALALEPTKQEVRHFRDEMRLKMVSQKTLRNHLNGESLHITTEESVANKNRAGLNWDPDVIDRMENAHAKLNSPFVDLIRGWKYLCGLCGVPQNYERAAGYFAKAAAKGYAEGQYRLSLMSMEGKGVKKDIKSALSLLQKAAQSSPLNEYGMNNLGVAESQFVLANCYRYGIGVDKNPSVASVWYTKSSENGCADAAHALGVSHMTGGCGIPQNFAKGLQYLKLAASRRHSEAMECLAHYYVNNGHLEMAEVWYNRAVNNGNKLAEFKRAEFDAQIVKWKNSEELKAVLKYEMLNRVDPGDLTLVERISRMNASFLSPEDREMYMKSHDAFEVARQRQPSLPSTVFESDRSSYWIDGRYDFLTAEKYAMRGCKFAKTLLEAMTHFKTALDVLRSLELPSKRLAKREVDYEKFLRHFSKAVRLEQSVAVFPVDVLPIVSAISLRVMKTQKQRKTRLDKDARTCYTWVLSSSLEECCNFVRECTKKYEDDAFFHSFNGSICGFLRQWEEAEKAFRRALLLDADNPDSWYPLASVLRQKQKPVVIDEVIQTYKTYLQKAPVDHRFYPDAYYFMSMVLFENVQDEKGIDYLMSKESVDILSKIKEYYLLGEQAEKNQLPFYLPYKSASKPVIGTLIKALDSKLKEHKNAASSSVTKSVDETDVVTVAFEDCHLPKITLEKLTDPQRVEIIRRHRVDLKSLNMFFARLPPSGHLCSISLLSSRAAKRQKTPQSLAGLQAVTLQDMDPTVDHIYEGSVLEVTFIEDAILGSTIDTVIQDVNGDIQRCFIYNYEHGNNGFMVRNVFGVGKKMNIMNPYFRICFDGKSAIRVDDPKSLVHLSDESQPSHVCRFCMAPDAKLVCGRCKVARYCDKACQSNDWKIYNHRLICQKPIDSAFAQFSHVVGF